MCQYSSVATHLYLDYLTSYSGVGILNFGYMDINFFLALSVVKCQLMHRLA